MASGRANFRAEGANDRTDRTKPYKARQPRGTRGSSCFCCGQEKKNCTRNKKTSKGAGECDRDLDASLKSSQRRSATLNNVHIEPQKTEDSEGGQGDRTEGET